METDERKGFKIAVKDRTESPKGPAQGLGEGMLLLAF